MSLPDTTTCPDACRSYRQWDSEAARELEIERMRESFIKDLTAETGKHLFHYIATSLSFDDERLRQQEIDLAWISLMAFYGPNDKRTAYRNQIITLADRMAARMYQIICIEAEKEAERVIREMEEK